jgi:hypothetical protein
MTMKYKPSITMTRERVAGIFHGMGIAQHTAVFWRECQKTSAKKPAAKKTLVKRVA